MEKLALQSLWSRQAPVATVTGDWVAERRHMSTNLVSTAGLGPHLDKTVPIEFFHHPIGRFGLLAAGCRYTLKRVFGRTCQR